MASTKSLLNLAKGNKKDKADAKKTTEKKVEEKPLTPEEERDLKAKQKVDELLKDSDLTLKKDDELLEVEQEPEQPKDVEWLTEQVGALSSENQILKDELAVAKADYRKIFDENQKIRSGAGITPTNDNSYEAILTLFGELQSNYLNYAPANRDKTTVNVRYLLNRMSALFPGVSKIRRF